MKKIIISALLLASCGGATNADNPTTTTTAPDTYINVYEYQENNIAFYVAEVRLSPEDSLQTAVKSGLTSELSNKKDAWVAINGDYFTYRDNGIIMRNGELLINEPRRQGMAITADGEMIVYNESTLTLNMLTHYEAVHAFSFGPILMQNGAVNSNLDDYYEVDEGRSINGKHPRTGVCMVRPGYFIFIVVDGRSRKSEGIDLPEFAELFSKYGCKVAYNLDGGGSSVLYFNGEVVNSPPEGERTNGDIIYVGQE
jgi:exopolysaccharide biosynthesis protein